MAIGWNHTVEVIAIQKGDATGWMEAAAAIGEIEFDSIESFLNNTYDFVQGARISRLHLQAHGDSEAVYFGSDILNVDSFKTIFRPSFATLTPFFAPGAVVALRACEIGQNVALLQNFAACWNVTVVAGRGYENNVYNSNTGRYVTVTPGGNVTTSIFLPSEADYQGGGAVTRLWQKYHAH